MTENRSFGANMYVSAFLLSLVNVTLIWIVVMYPVSATQGTIHLYFHILTVTIVFFIIYFWALYGSKKVSEVVYRSCRFGAILSLLLPVITGLISVFWTTGIADRPAAFFNGYTSLEIPVYAAGIAILLIVIFLGGSFLAERSLQDTG